MVEIVCSVFLPAKDLTDVTRDRVVLVYMLMKEMPINVGAILRQNIMKFRNNLRWRFCYGGLVTHFLSSHEIEKEMVDMSVARHPELTGKLVDIMRTKELDTSHEPVLSTPHRQAQNNSVMTHMFGMTELQLQSGGLLVTDEEMKAFAERYPLIDNEAMDDDEDDDAVDEANVLMVFNCGDDKD
ncbi:hypothetical protein EJD97_019496 [Solanum chilense]|uniref:Uncharacterized protein n=1 Tax=Solanum chilense TaxID=4083 RepID=A0A6N2B169_SOLCI|nr:hypothetical protein EJD97_019496 [Solanum chilense]